MAASPTGNDAWAVGFNFTSNGAQKTLIEHWNGTSWAIVPSPDPGGTSHNNSLSGVAIPASGSGWAVGGYSNGTADRTLAAQCC